MAKYLRYYTEFTSVEGHTVRAEIMQEADSPFTPVELEIGSGDAPLVIEWAETDKISPIQGSTATLVVNSSSDRQLLHLASVLAPGDIRMDVYRDGALWWSGTLDNEFYEEPYTSKNNYDVSLTFMDFGPLNRIPWQHTGRESYEVILKACLNAAGLVYNAHYLRAISTRFANGTSLNIRQLILDNDNFYDEEREAMTCFDVLSGILQPFALRIVQRGGGLLLYDLNAAYDFNAEDVEWKGDDAVLSHDRVYSDAVVIFSPYVQEPLLDAEVKDVTVEATHNVKTSYDTRSGYSLLGFNLFIGSEAVGGAVLENGAKFFTMEPVYSSSEASGIIWTFNKLNDSPGYHSYNQLLQAPSSCFGGGGTSTSSFVGQRIATFPSQYVHEPDAGARSHYKLRINLDLLLDVRYNPFEDAGEYNEQGDYKTMVDKCGFVYVPMMVTLRDAPGGNALYHLENRNVALGDGLPSSSGGATWVTGAGSPGCFFLAWYDHDDRDKGTGVGGWATNRMCIGHYTSELPTAWSIMEQGEYVPLPPVAGYLEVELYSGFHIRNRDIVTSIYSSIRWAAYKNAKITLVKSNGKPIETADQEDVSHINADAQEECSVDTIVGTLMPASAGDAYGRGVVLAGGSLCARGLIDRNSTTLNKFQRAGISDRLEKLLLGTIYSQYAERKITLSGTVAITSAIVLTDSPRIQGKYIMMADTQDMRDDTSRIVMTEFGPDEYEGIDYE